jgi:hypothetical protein
MNVRIKLIFLPFHCSETSGCVKQREQWIWFMVDEKVKCPIIIAPRVGEGLGIHWCNAFT